MAAENMEKYINKAKEQRMKWQQDDIPLNSKMICITVSKRIEAQQAAKQ